MIRQSKRPLLARCWARIGYLLGVRCVPWLAGMIPVLGVALLSPGCCPCRHLGTSQRDSVRVVTSVQTIERLVRDTAWMAIAAQAQRVEVRDTMSLLENDYALSRAWVHPGGVLEHTLQTKAQRRAVEVLRREIQTVRTDTVCIDRVRCDVVEVARPLTWWQQTQIRGCWIALSLLLLLGAAWRLRRR